MHLKSVHDTLDDKRLERRIMELENCVHSLGRQKINRTVKTSKIAETKGLLKKDATTSKKRS